MIWLQIEPRIQRNNARMITTATLLRTATAVVLLSCVCDTTSTSNDTKTIYFMAAGPRADNGSFEPSWAGGTAVIHAVKLACDHINLRSEILPGYRLEVIEADSGCNIKSKYAIAFSRQFVENSRGKTIAGIIGPGCSDSALLMAPVLAKGGLNVVQIAPSATSPQLVNDTFNTTFRIFSSTLIYVDEFNDLSRHNHWRKVAVLYDGTRTHFRIAYQRFLKIKDPGMTVSFESALYDDFFPVAEIRDLQTRVIFVFAAGSTARKALCLAYHLGIVYPTFQWLFHDRDQPNFEQNITVSHNEEHYTCSEREMRRAMNGIVLNNYVFAPNSPGERHQPVNISYNEYKQQYFETLEKTKESMVGFKWAGSYYDATWALALAITNSLPELAPRFDKYSLGDGEIARIITDNLLNHSVVNFRGVSESPVKFKSTRETQSTLSIVKMKCNSSACEDQLLGQYDANGLQLYDNFTQHFINDTFEATTVTIHAALGAIIFLTILVILIVTILMHLATIIYYNFKPIKATSPNLSHLIFSGCYLLLISIFFFIVKDVFDFDPTGYGVLCNLYTLCLSMSLSLVFGTICAKIWRVYRIFRHFRTERAAGAISDNALIFFVSILVCVDMVFGVIWIMFDPWLQKSTGVFSGTEVVVTPTCTCTHLLQWIIALGGYKAMLILAVVLLAIMNRNIQKKEFKHTKKVSMYVYTEIMMAGITLPLFQILTAINVTASSVVMSMFLLATVCGCLCFVFLPSILPLIKIKYRGQPISLHMARRSTISLLN